MFAEALLRFVAFHYIAVERSDLFVADHLAVLAAAVRLHMAVVAGRVVDEMVLPVSLGSFVERFLGPVEEVLVLVGSGRFARAAAVFLVEAVVVELLALVAARVESHEQIVVEVHPVVVVVVHMAPAVAAQAVLGRVLDLAV